MRAWGELQAWLRRNHPATARRGTVLALAAVVAATVILAVSPTPSRLPIVMARAEAGTWIRALGIGFGACFWVLRGPWAAGPRGASDAIRQAYAHVALSAALLAVPTLPWLAVSATAALTTDRAVARAVHCASVGWCAADPGCSVRDDDRAAYVLRPSESCAGLPSEERSVRGRQRLTPDEQAHRVQMERLWRGHYRANVWAGESLRWRGEIRTSVFPDPRVMAVGAALAGAVLALLGLAATAAMPRTRVLSSRDGARVVAGAVGGAVGVPLVAWGAAGSAVAAGIAPSTVALALAAAFVAALVVASAALLRTLRRARFAPWVAIGWPVMAAATALSPALVLGTFRALEPGPVQEETRLVLLLSSLVATVLFVPAFAWLNERVATLQG